MFKIGTFNKISPVGLNKLTDEYTIIDDHNEAQGIILRSYDMHEMDFSDNLLAIGRAGAGTNNIPVDRCAQQGIVVFNSPGANANADISYHLSILERLRMEIEYHLVVTRLHVDGTEDIIHTSQFYRLIIYGSSPSRIVNL